MTPYQAVEDQPIEPILEAEMSKKHQQLQILSYCI